MATSRTRKNDAFPGMPTGLPFTAPPGMEAMFTLAQQLRGWTESMTAMSGPATELAAAAASSQVKDPEQRDAILKAGKTLRQMRESAGMTVQEVAKAMDMSDPGLLENAENGGVALPFEVLLRLSGVVGRDDPVTSMTRLTRAYNPDLWKTMEQLGFGKLLVQAGRERELANVYRGNDAARGLSDQDFAQVVEFAKQAFDMAVGMLARGKGAE
jgi:transcriptional regulator with XRE-family HTH domain